MRKLLVALLLASGPVFGQNGYFFLSHFSPGDAQLNYRTFGMAQDDHGIITYATRSGLLTFDGREWNLTSGVGAVYSVTSDDKGRVFFGGSDGFGEFQAEQRHVLFWSDTTARNVYSCAAVGDKVLFLSDAGIYVYTKDGRQSYFRKADNDTVTYTNVYNLFDVPYVATARGRLLRMSGDKLIPLKENVAINAEIIFASRFENNYLVGTADSKVYRLDEGFSFTEVKLEDGEYAEAGKIMNGVWVNGRMAAVGTLRAGVILFNPLTGKTDQVINYAAGLPDNEVFSLMVDKNANIWVAHDYGFTRMAPYLPFRSFTHYNGLSGNVLCAKTFKGNIYVGTSVGLFKLQRQDVYQEVVYYVTTNKTVETEEKGKSEDDNKQKKGFLGFLRRNKESKSEEPAPTKGSKVITVREKRTKKVLMSSSYVFKPVTGIDSKVSQLQEWNGKLLASGLSGVFLVDDLKAEAVFEQPVKYLLVASSSHVLIFTTYNDELGLITSVNGKTQVSSLGTSIREPIHYFFNGTGNEIWACGLENVYRLELARDTVHAIAAVKLANPNLDETLGATVKGSVVFVNSSGIYRLDAQLKPVKIDTLASPPQSFFASPSNVWFTNSKGWRSLTGDVSNDNLEFLALLRNIRYLSPDENGQRLWVVAGNNELYKFFGDRIVPYTITNPVFLKEVELMNHTFTDFHEVRIEEQNSKVTFKAVQPDYLNASFISYRYLLKGLSTVWSDWSLDNDFAFPYLPAGKYTLMVEARNIFGKVTSMSPAAFEVIPPYWRRSWFYAMEATVFALLVILSFRLSERYRIVSRFLSLLTIILLIEFIQTVAGAMFATHSSPVLDFLIQVVVAFLILPVEGLLRKLIIQSIESKQGLYRIIVPESRRKEKET